VAQAFDLVGITSSGCPSFVFLAKGGSHELVRRWVYLERQSVVSAKRPTSRKGREKWDTRQQESPAFENREDRGSLSSYGIDIE
jgi:hypothetical protein